MSRQISQARLNVNPVRKSLRARLACESLEGRALLSGMGTSTAADGWHSFAAGAGHTPGIRAAAEIQTRATHTGASQGAMNGGGAGDFQFKGGPGRGQELGGGGVSTLSDLVGLGMGGPGGGGGGKMAMRHGQPAGTATPPTLAAAVTTAQSTLKTDLHAALPAGFQTPSKDTLDALQTDLKAQRAGTLTGTDATTKLQADKDAILASTGLTASQAAAVAAAGKQLETDLNAAKPTGKNAPPTTPNPTITADKDAILAAAGLSSAQITAIDAARTRMMSDGEAIHAGTLTGDAATAAMKADHDSLLSALGVSQTNIDKIDADTTALQAAMTTAFGSMTPPTSHGMPTPRGGHARRFGRG